jgi:hypothetical protein
LLPADLLDPAQVVQRSDAARWLILYKFGGVYIDNGEVERGTCCGTVASMTVCCL